MKLYAFITPEISKHDGFLKIGETNGSIEKRIAQEGHELNVRKEIVWHDAVITERSRIDKMIHRYLVDQGFEIQQFDATGQDTEWVKCTVTELKKAFAVVKQQIYREEQQREEICNKFYLEIRNWFYWTVQYAEAEPEYTLRLIVRLMLCFFLREKELVPKELFDENWFKENLKENNESRYYNGILRNLFFHCLNSPIKERKIFEHTNLIKNVGKIKEQLQKIPFLNGGLFNESESDHFPLSNRYFFEELHTESIQELDGNYKVEGIIRILSKYQYKLSLDDLLDQSEYTNTVDPEFLGKVFESLLACVDADTKDNRRKVTGSFYTPREIVNYMVNEALEEYLKNNNDLLQCKILDPACGSGAFPCGVMNEILYRIDPDKQLSQIERYYKKLEILQNVIYGIDLQPMAVQITEFRLFLSLIQDLVPNKKKENYGIEPLPNLETKFVCANTLIGLPPKKFKDLPIVATTIKMLLETRNQYFHANNPKEKKRLQEYDMELRNELLSIYKDPHHATYYSSATAELIKNWNPYDQTQSATFFDPQWMFGVSDGFDIVIGNPPYVESRSASVSETLKTQYQNQVKIVFGNLSQYITKGSDLLIYFFPRSITLLSEQGIGMLIVQNGWLNTDYGAKAAQFLVKTLQYVKTTDSPFRHFDRASANVNTVITRFKKQSDVKKVCFDIMDRDGTNQNRIVTKEEKSFDLGDNILSNMKWGMIMSTDNDLFSTLKKVIEKGKEHDQSFYSIGQGINVNKRTFIPKNEESKFVQKTNMINAVFKEYQYTYTDFSYFLYHSFTPNESDVSVLKTINAEEFDADKSFTRKYPAVIMPRGIGALHFAGLLNNNALSNSFVDIYMKTRDEEKKLNIWLFCNSSLFFLYREISGRKNLGGGLLKSEAADIKLFPLYFPITDTKSIFSLLKKMGTPVHLRERLNTAIQKEIDQLVFSYFAIPPKLQSKIINELLRLFDFRCNRAKN
ncbi:MAG: N-6 DNA methylase [Planctomycetaceae bacterium]|jgi:methylase of polypeptide subunit release factors|nr:N-6 DNA methylase [Planctomycetaceae bacterium]